MARHDFPQKRHGTSAAAFRSLLAPCSVTETCNNSRTLVGWVPLMPPEHYHPHRCFAVPLQQGESPLPFGKGGVTGARAIR